MGGGASELITLAGASVSGLVLATAVGIRTAGESEKIREQLQRNEEDEGREPFLDSGDGEPVAGGIVRGGCGDMKGDAMRADFASGAENLARARVGGATGEDADERRALVHFGKRAVEELLGLGAFGGLETCLLDLEGDFARGGPVGARAENHHASTAGDFRRESFDLWLRGERLAHQVGDFVE